MTFGRVLLTVLLLTISGWTQDHPSTKRILFVGNSLTAYNDLPAIVRTLADYTPNLRLSVDSVVIMGASLQDQWDDGRAVRKIQGAKWDVVVLQQGPSSQPAYRPEFLSWAARFAKIIRQSGGIPGLYMVWPAANRSGDFDGVHDAYKSASEKVEGYFFPAGDAWRAAWKKNPKLALYGSDNFHPSTRGSYLAALVIVGTLCECSTRNMPSHLLLGWGNGQTIDIPQEEAAILQEAADEAVSSAATRMKPRPQSSGR